MTECPVPAEKQGFSALLHGASKSGKSTLGMTVPYPALVLDAEGSTKFIRTQGFGSEHAIRRRSWNPLTSAPPLADGTWDVCVVRAQSWQTIKMAYDYIESGQHQFRSAVLDSVTEIQNKCKRNMSVSVMQQQDWGKLLEMMDTLMRGLRDLTEVESNPLETVVFIAETKMQDGRWTPYMQGAIGARMPYWVDVCGFVEQVDALDANGQATLRNVHMTIVNNERSVAGERLQGILPKVILNPNISVLHQIIYAGSN